MNQSRPRPLSSSTPFRRSSKPAAVPRFPRRRRQRKAAPVAAAGRDYADWLLQGTLVATMVGLVAYHSRGIVSFIESLSL